MAGYLFLLPNWLCRLSKIQKNKIQNCCKKLNRNDRQPRMGLSVTGHPKCPIQNQSTMDNTFGKHLNWKKTGRFDVKIFGDKICTQVQAKYLLLLRNGGRIIQEEMQGAEWNQESKIKHEFDSWRKRTLNWFLSLRRQWLGPGTHPFLRKSCHRFHHVRICYKILIFDDNTWFMNLDGDFESFKWLKILLNIDWKIVRVLVMGA